MKPILIAVTGGSGAGKSWLAARLEWEFGPDAAKLSLDDFYHDFSHLPPPYRDKLNFDDPDAIDWDLFEAALGKCRAGRQIELPQYDFTTHTRLSEGNSWRPARLVFVEGLWLLERPSVWAMFDLRIFLDCPEALRAERRLARDVSERGRTPESVQEQFYSTVAPMHYRFVEPQMILADIVLREPLQASDFDQLLETIRALKCQSERTTAPQSRPEPTRSLGSATGRTDSPISYEHTRT